MSCDRDPLLPRALSILALTQQKGDLPASLLSPLCHGRFVSSAGAMTDLQQVLKQDRLQLVLDVKLLHSNVSRPPKTFSFLIVNLGLFVTVRIQL